MPHQVGALLEQVKHSLRISPAPPTGGVQVRPDPVFIGGNRRVMARTSIWRGEPCHSWAGGAPPLRSEGETPRVLSSAEQAQCTWTHFTGEYRHCCCDLDGVGGMEEWMAVKLDAGVVRTRRPMALGLWRCEQGCSGFVAPAKNCTHRMSVCSFNGSTLASAWRWRIGEELVQPVATRRAAFCVRCRAFIWERDRSGHQARLAYCPTPAG